MINLNDKFVWVAYRNTDLNEGRGQNIVQAICRLESTAIRLGKGKDVQGSNCRVVKVNLLVHSEKLYAPIDLVTIIEPSKEDIANQQVVDKKQLVIEKMRKSGFTEDEIKVVIK